MANTVVFIDSRVNDVNALISRFAVGTEYYVLDSERDGIVQISEALAGRSGSYDSLQIFSHGAPGSLMLGSTVLTSSSLAAYSAQLALIGGALSASGDILLYGCNVAAGTVGQQFIAALAEATGADVAASVDVTGSAALGGDWELEYTTGAIESSVDAALVQGYEGVFAPPPATTISITLPTEAEIEAFNSDLIDETDVYIPLPSITIDTENLLSTTEQITLTIVSSNGKVKFNNYKINNVSHVTGNNTSEAVVTGTVSQIRSLLNDGNVTYVLTTNYSGIETLSAQISGVLSDGTTPATGNASSILTVTGDNDAPTLTNVPVEKSFNEGSSDNNVFDDTLVLADPDIAGYTMQAELTVTEGTLDLTTTDGLTFTVGANGNDSFTIQGTRAALETALKTLQYTPDATFIGANTDADTLTLTVNDLGSSVEINKNQGYNVNNTSAYIDNTITKTVKLNVINHPPVLDALQNPSLTTITEDINVTINEGSTVADIVVDSSVTDIDRVSPRSPLEYIYIMSADSAHGDWEFKLSPNGAWTPFNWSGSNAGLALLLTAADSIRFLPDADWNGTASFVFGAWDSIGGYTVGSYVQAIGAPNNPFSEVQDTAYITVTSVNDIPTFTTLSAAVDTVDEDTEVEITFNDIAVKGNEADVDGTVDAFIVKAVSSGELFIGTDEATASLWNANDNATIDATHKAYWTPAQNANGINANALSAFTVVAKDNDGDESDTGAVTVKVNVTPVNDPPTITPGTQSGTLTEDGSTATVSMTMAMADVDTPDTVKVDEAWLLSEQTATSGTHWKSTDGGTTYTIAGSYGTATLTKATGTVSYNFTSPTAQGLQHLAAGATTTESFKVVVSDTASATATADATFTITGANDNASITISGSPDTSVTEDSTNSTAGGTLSVRDVDDGETVFGTVDTADLTGTYGDFTFTTDGVWTYTLDDGDDNDSVNGLAEGETAYDTLTVTSTDGTASATITVTITGTNDPASITAGDQSTDLTEDGTTEASITLTISDPDGSEDANYDLTYLTDNGWDESTIGEDTVYIKSGNYGTATFDPDNDIVSYVLNNSDTDTQALDDGDVASDSFTIQVSDGLSSDAETITFTIAGTNDAPTIDVSDTGDTIPESDDASMQTLSSSGSISWDDVDASDTVTLTHSSNDDMAWTGGTDTFTTDLDSDFIDDLVDGFSVSAGEDGNGSWSYNVTDVDLDFLGDGEQLTWSYTVTASDGTDSTVATDTVNFTITGENDAPTITAGDHITITENSGSDSPDLQILSASDSISVDDLDVHDTVTVTSSLDSISWLNSIGEDAGTLSQDIITSLTDGFSADEDGWSYDVSDVDLNFIGEDETVVLSYNVTASDGIDTATDTVTVTIEGTNDTPTVDVVETGITFAEDDTLSDSGTVSFSDLDTNDVIDVTESYNNDIAWSGGTLTDEIMSGEDISTLTNGFTAWGEDLSSNEIVWNYSATLGTDDLDFLDDDETLTFSYTVTATDNHDESATDSITVTITGENDAPTIDSIDDGYTFTEADNASAQTLSDSGTVSYTDVDANDTVSVTYSSNADISWSGEDSDSNLSSTISNALVNGFSTDDNGWDYSVGGGDGGVIGTGYNPQPVIFSADNYQFTSLIEATIDSSTYNAVGNNYHYKYEFTDIQDGATVTAFLSVDTPNTPYYALSSWDVNENLINGYECTDPGDNGISLQWTYHTGDTLWVGALTQIGAYNLYLSDGRSAPGINLDFIGVNETVTWSYDVTASDGDASDVETVSFTITGENDDPTISISDHTFTEDDGNQTLTTSGTITYDDVDENDTVTINSSYNSDIAWSGDDANSDLDATLATILRNGFIRNGSSWSYGVTGVDLDFVGADETIIFSYDVTATDNHSGWETDTISITIDGTNDDVDITGGTTSGSITEVADKEAFENDMTLTATGSFTITDPDVNDNFTATFTDHSASDNLTYLGDFDVDDDGDWSFSVEDEDLDYLDENDTLIQTYTVTISDGNGSTDTQDVTITIHGSDDNASVAGRVYYWSNFDEITDVVTEMYAQDSMHTDGEDRGIEFRDIVKHDNGTYTLDIYKTADTDYVDNFLIKLQLAKGSVATWEQSHDITGESNDLKDFGFVTYASSLRTGECNIGGYSASLQSLPDNQEVKLGTLTITAPIFDAKLLAGSYIGNTEIDAGDIFSEMKLNVTYGEDITYYNGDGLYNYLNQINSGEDFFYYYDSVDPDDYNFDAIKEVTTEDANEVTPADALLALKLSMGINTALPDLIALFEESDTIPLIPYMYMAADVNKDGKVTIQDALNILKMSVNYACAPEQEWIFSPLPHNEQNILENMMNGFYVTYVDDSGEDVKVDWLDIKGINGDETGIILFIGDNEIPIAEWNIGVDWEQASPELHDITVTDEDLQLVDLIGILKGDVNGSWGDPIDFSQPN